MERQEIKAFARRVQRKERIYEGTQSFLRGLIALVVVYVGLLLFVLVLVAGGAEYTDTARWIIKPIWWIISLIG